MATSLARLQQQSDLERFTLTAERKELLRKTIANGLTVPEFDLFAEYVVRVQLDPFRRQIHPIKVDGKLTIHVGIDGLRLLAERSGEYEGQDGPLWCGTDGAWQEVWLDETTPPAAAKVVLHRTGRRPMSGVARFAEYAQWTTNRQGVRVLRHMWQTFPSVMLAKCAEAVAIRRAFPTETSGLYVSVDEDGEVSDRPQVVQRGAKASDYQIGELHRLAKALGFSDEERHDRAGVVSFKDLQRGPASDLIDEWTRLHDDGEILDGEVVEDGLGADSGDGRVPSPAGASAPEQSDSEALDTPLGSDSAETVGDPGDSPAAPPPAAAIDRVEVDARLLKHFGSRPKLWAAAQKRFPNATSLSRIGDGEMAAWLADAIGGKDGGS